MMRPAVSVFLCLLAFGAALAAAEQVGSGDQIVSFSASINPSKLLRDRDTPVTIHAAGKIKPTATDRLARLRSLEIAFNRHGKLFTKGLPICHMGQLVATSSKTALEECKSSLVGHGQIVARQLFVEQGVFEVEGALLLFYGKYRGSRAIFLHVYNTVPPSAVVIPFKVSRTSGTFGTTLKAPIARFINTRVDVSQFEFVLGRLFSYRGQVHGFVQASCPAPKGSNEAIVPFARVTFRFPTTKTLRTTLVRSCHVRNDG